MAKCTGRGLVVKRPGVLSKVQILTLVLGVGVISLLPSSRIQTVVLRSKQEMRVVILAGMVVFVCGLAVGIDLQSLIQNRALSEYCFACGSRMRSHLRG